MVNLVLIMLGVMDVNILGDYFVIQFFGFSEVFFFCFDVFIGEEIDEFEYYLVLEDEGEDVFRIEDFIEFREDNELDQENEDEDNVGDWSNDFNLSFIWFKILVSMFIINIDYYVKDVYFLFIYFEMNFNVVGVFCCNQVNQ